MTNKDQVKDLIESAKKGYFENQARDLEEAAETARSFDPILATKIEAIATANRKIGVYLLLRGEG